MNLVAPDSKLKGLKIDAESCSYNDPDVNFVLTVPRFQLKMSHYILSGILVDNIKVDGEGVGKWVWLVVLLLLSKMSIPWYTWVWLNPFPPRLETYFIFFILLQWIYK